MTISLLAAVPILGRFHTARSTSLNPSRDDPTRTGELRREVKLIPADCRNMTLTEDSRTFFAQELSPPADPLTQPENEKIHINQKVRRAFFLDFCRRETQCVTTSL
jgi:hypothetical protein